MRILVTGANGFLGSHVVEILLKKDHEVSVLIRPSSPLPIWADKVKVFRLDLRHPPDLSEALQNVDAVIHLAAATSGNEEIQFSSTVVGTENLLAAMTQFKVRRLVHVSSIVVYSWSKIERLMEETSPLNQNIYDMGGYAIAKFWQERLVGRYSDSNVCNLTVLRPGFIWGKHHAKIAGMGRQLGIFHFVIGPTTTLPITHVVNCAHFIVSATESPATIGQVLNVTDGDSISSWEYVGQYIRHSGRRGIRIPIPYWIGLIVAIFASKISLLLFGKKGKLPSILSPKQFEAQFKPLEFSTAKSKEIMNWTPPLSYIECIEKTYGTVVSDTN